jgi:hypothetical protein
MGRAFVLRNPLMIAGITVASVTVAMLALGLAGCSSSTPSPAGPVDASPVIPVSSCVDAGLTIAFSPMYSAFDGTHTFQVPALVVGSNSQVTWSADATMVGMQSDPERSNEVLITMLKPGVTLINVNSADGQCGSAPLTIDSALESDWEIGNARYNDGKSLHLAAAANGGTGSPLESATGGGPACTSCHGETATNGPFTDVSHTPEQTGGYSDADLLNIILHGTFPPGAYFDTSIVTYPAWMNFHRWDDITSDQQKGIIVYLRSLTPAPQKGMVNFGAFDQDSGNGVAGDEAGGGDDAGDAGDDVVVEAEAGDE